MPVVPLRAAASELLVPVVVLWIPIHGLTLIIPKRSPATILRIWTPGPRPSWQTRWRGRCRWVGTEAQGVDLIEGVIEAESEQIPAAQFANRISA